MNHLIALLFIFAAGQANAQQYQCAGYDDLTRILGTYSETLLWRGPVREFNTVMAPQGVSVEMWVGPKSWTLILVNPNGAACIVGDGGEVGEPA
jgi:hypothetical protein